MLLERFGSGSSERAGGDLLAGMTQRLALCRAFLHEPELLVLDEPFSALDEAGAALLDRELEELAASGRWSSRPTIRRGWSAMRARGSLSHDVRGRRDGARAQDARSSSERGTRCPRCCCSSSRRSSSSASRFRPTRRTTLHGLLWVAIVFTALLGLSRAWVPEQEHGVLDGLVLAPCDRAPSGSARRSRRSPSSRRRSWRSGVRALLRPAGRDRDRRRGARRHRHLRRRLAPGGDGGRQPSPRAPVAAARPSALDHRHRRCRQRNLAEGERFLLFLVLYDAVFAVLSWASFEYVVTE